LKFLVQFTEGCRDPPEHVGSHGLVPDAGRQARVIILGSAQPVGTCAEGRVWSGVALADRGTGELLGVCDWPK